MGDASGRRAEMVRAALQTDVGAVRVRNEDAAYMDGDGRFFVLADGMGGCAGGDVASATAVDVVRTLLAASAHELIAFANRPTEVGRRRMCALVDRAVRDANDVVRERARVEPRYRGMGTTLEVAVVLGGELFLAHVGDSRTYLIRDGEIRALTDDHTVAEQMRRAGTMSADEACWSPLRSVLTNAVGVSTSLAIDHTHEVLEAGDRLLVCSDGLYEYFTRDELAEVVREGSPESSLDELVGAARARGGNDNITGIVIEVPTLRRAPALAGLTDDALVAFVEHALGEDFVQLDAEV